MRTSGADVVKVLDKAILLSFSIFEAHMKQKPSDMGLLTKQSSGLVCKFDLRKVPPMLNKKNKNTLVVNCFL